MSNDLYWLGLTLAATALFWLPYVLNRMLVRGVMGTLANPSADDAPLAPWAQRAQRAHTNAIENLAVFAPAVLAAHAAGHGTDVTVLACQIYSSRGSRTIWSTRRAFPSCARWRLPRAGWRP